jgi:hypothetical protein
LPAPVVSAAVEGDLDAAVVRRLIGEVGLPVGSIFGRKGKSRLDKHLPGYNNAARLGPWFVLRDLDHDAPCAAQLVQGLLPAPAPRMCLRVAVREVEAWLLADYAGMAKLFQLPIDQIPRSPESLDDPKGALVQLARRSPNRTLRQEIVPAPRTTAKVGPGYTARMIDFAARLWLPRTAALASPSLASCLRAIERWKPGRPDQDSRSPRRIIPGRE